MDSDGLDEALLRPVGQGQGLGLSPSIESWG